jgi:hypothetical protein
MIIGALACVVLPFTFSSANVDYSTMTLQPYTDSLGNYAIGLPEGWKTSSSELGGITSYVKCTGQRSTTITVTCSLESDLKTDITKALSLGKESPLKPEHLNSVDRMSFNRKDLEATEPQEIVVADREAFLSTVKYTSSRGFSVKKMKCAIVTAWNGSAPVSIQFTSPEKDFDQVYPLFERCVETFTPHVGTQN